MNTSLLIVLLGLGMLVMWIVVLLLTDQMDRKMEEPSRTRHPDARSEPVTSRHPLTESESLH